MLVSKAANLNESQIQELANLQRGVAAIYQNGPNLSSVTSNRMNAA